MKRTSYGVAVFLVWIVLAWFAVALVQCHDRPERKVKVETR